MRVNKEKDMGIDQPAKSRSGHGGARPSKRRLILSSIQREFLSVFIMLLTIVGIEAVAAATGHFNAAGLVLLGGFVAAAIYGGFRAALVCCGILALYIYLIYTYPISSFEVKSEGRLRAMLETLILFPTIAVIVGLVQAKLRKARTEELRAKTTLRSVEFQKDAALEANKFKSHFVSSMSHELRTPLNAILGFAQLLELKYDDPDIQESSGAIIKAGKHLLNLINEILDLAKIEAGQLALSLEPVDLDSVVSQVFEMTKAEADHVGVRLIANKEPAGEHIVMADHRRLLQVLINVVSNGIKYNRRGGSVLIERQMTSDGACEILVTDTGTGVLESEKEALFEPFVRVGDNEVEGTGLGLSLARSFLTLMGGSVELKSSSASGSTFRITLLAGDGEAPSIPKKVSDRASCMLDTGEKTVIYIEDNASNYRLLELAFKSWGCNNLIWGVDGRTGLNLARSRTPDLVLLDLNLPDIRGEDVLRRLKADPETTAIPVVVVSAEAAPKLMTKLIGLGAADYLTKPINLTELARVVEGVFEGKASTAAEART